MGRKASTPSSVPLTLYGFTVPDLLLLRITSYLEEAISLLSQLGSGLLDSSLHSSLNSEFFQLWYANSKSGRFESKTPDIVSCSVFMERAQLHLKNTGEELRLYKLINYFYKPVSSIIWSWVIQSSTCTLSEPNIIFKISLCTVRKYADKSLMVNGRVE